MMGKKERVFSPLPRDVSLEELVPEDSFYRSLEAGLDLSFVRDLVRPLYARGAGYRWTRWSSSRQTIVHLLNGISGNTEARTSI